MVRVGFITLPFSGDFNTIFIFTGFLSACVWTTVAFNMVTPKGPALGEGTSEKIIDALGTTMIVQAVWCILYYNYIGAQVLSVFFGGPWEVLDKTKQTDKWNASLGRFSGNQFEQSVVFIPCLWAYAMFVDFETAGALGVLYCINRAIYPLFYVIHGRFTFAFEHITQVGYAVNGTFMLGLIVRGAKWDYIKFADDNQIIVPILGAVVGVFTLLPGIGVTLPWFALFTYADRKRQAAELQKTAQP
jgi:hypothetical protein